MTQDTISVSVTLGENDNGRSEVTTASIGVGFGQGTTVSRPPGVRTTANDHEYQYMKLDHSYGDGSIAVYYKRGETDGGQRRLALSASASGTASVAAPPPTPATV